VRKTNNTNTQSIMAAGKSGPTAHVHMFLDTTGPLFKASGRRLDADSSVNSTGISANTNWGVQIGRYNWSSAILQHTVEATTETLNPFQTAGLTSNTPLTYITVGSNSINTISNAKFTTAFLVSDLLTDPETAALVTALSAAKAS
jgi:hypothetical protein